MTEEQILPLLANMSEQATVAMDKSTAQFTAGVDQVDNQFSTITMIGGVIIALAIIIGVRSWYLFVSLFLVHLKSLVK